MSKDLNSKIIGNSYNQYLNEGDCVIDYVGSASTNNQALSVLKSKGLITVGFDQPLVKVGFDHLIQREIKIIGVHGYNCHKYNNSVTFQKVIKYVENKKLILDDYITDVFDIKDYKKGLKKANSHFINLNKNNDLEF